MAVGEIGWVRIEFDDAAQNDALLAGAPRELDVNEWHNYACTPPAGAAMLARSPACIQAFRVGATTLGPAVPRRGDATRCWRNGRRRPPTSSQARPPAEVMLGTDEQRAEQLRLAARIGDRFARAVLAAADPRLGATPSRGRHLRSSARGDGAHDVPARLLRRLRRARGRARGRPHQARARRSGASRRRGKLCRKCSIGYNGAFLDPRAAADDAAAARRAEGRGGASSRSVGRRRSRRSPAGSARSPTSTAPQASSTRTTPAPAR